MHGRTETAGHGEKITIDVDRALEELIVRTAPVRNVSDLQFGRRGHVANHMALQDRNTGLGHNFCREPRAAGPAVDDDDTRTGFT